MEKFEVSSKPNVLNSAQFEIFVLKCRLQIFFHAMILDD